ncbi:Lin1244/Lin1753 domain-containing protein [Thalassobacillus sp. CUG 92003]|uniref:Lin1244/Lin1753 domain-containing protein n=1 Tax=Thalassobacillus sp. CUG 92003 TaxID=2736641 RepID=UPI0015E6BCC9|nr:Lin1244/Lin1753 domain-containing protein [Thalassobacillus sp. CUG 92003]
MKNTYYFSHDGNARNDPKILSMRSVYGSEGYGWYWIIVEMLREQDNYKIKINKYTWNALAMQMQCDANAVHQFVSDCINEFELFDSDGDFFWSSSLIKRMEVKDNKSEKARKAAQKRWQKPDDDKGSQRTQSTSNASSKQPHSERNAHPMPKKEKESKEKKSKENTTTTSSTDESENPFTFYENNFGVLNDTVIDSLNHWINDLGQELLIEAMKKAALSSKSYSYANGILKDWYRNNIRTLGDIHASEEQYAREQQRPKLAPVKEGRYKHAF